MEKYRPDIDGLRCLAVIPVVAFHAGFEKWVPGGFVGVDIFFVISGYLITGIIVRDIDNGTFSIKEFYARRIRRIFPALYVVYAACMIASLYSYRFPQDVEHVATAIIASIFFVSNILFDNATTYFSSASSLSNPLLHTWSLSVEEQFYVLFPFLAFGICRLTGAKRVTAVCVIAAASFAWSASQAYRDPASAFYLLQSRAWELLIGTYLAIGPVPVARQRWLLESTGMLGLVLIGGSVIVLSPESPLPAPSALPACLGAALLIYSGSANQTIAARVLAAPPLRFIGLISYSLYLWHWPIVCFFRRSPALYELDVAGQRMVIVGASVALATLSWWFVERPFRQIPFKRSSNEAIGTAAAAMLTVGIAALALGPIERLIRQPPPLAEALLAYERTGNEDHLRAGHCFLTTGYNAFAIFDKADCLHLDPSKANYLLLGDSHAAHLWIGLQETYPQINFLQATASGCMPELQAEGDRRCTDMMRYILDEFVPSTRLDGVILSARWQATDVDGALRTAAYLSKYSGRVIIAGPIREYFLTLPRLLAAATWDGTDIREAMSRSLQPERLMVDQKFLSSALPDRVIYLSTYKVVSSAPCEALMAANVPIQFDQSHLTEQGSRCVATQFAQALANPQ